MSRDLDHDQIREAIRHRREQVRWKPMSAARHLAKRIEIGHLESTATITTYEALIILVVTTPEAEVFV